MANKLPYQIAFLGFGNMAKAIAQSLVNSGLVTTQQIVVTSPSLSCGTKYTAFSVANTNRDAALFANAPHGVIILAVKPVMIPKVLLEIGSVITANTLLISIAAGTTLDSLAALLQHRAVSIVRAMPNIALLVGEGMTGLCANKWVNPQQLALTKAIFASSGEVLLCQQEAELNAVTAISGSGPAYFFYIQQIMIQHAMQVWQLPAEQALTLVSKTMLGAATMTTSTEQSLEELIAQVASKGGTTEAALQALRAGDLARVIASGLNAAFEKAQSIT